MLRHAEFIRYVLGKLADIELSVHHDDAHQGRRQEVGHIIVDGGQLADLGLVFRVDRIELLVDGLQLFVGALQLLIGGQQLLVGRLQLRVDGLQLRDRAAEVVLGDMELLLQVRDPLGRRGVNVVVVHVDGLLGLLGRPQKGQGRHTRVAPHPVRDWLGDQGDIFGLAADLHRDPVIGDQALLLPRLLQSLGDRDLEIISDQ